MEGIVAEICRDLLIRSPKAANSPRCEASKFPEPAPCSLQLLSHCSATLSHSLAAFKNNRLPTLAAGALSGCSYYHWDFAIIRK